MFSQIDFNCWLGWHLERRKKPAFFFSIIPFSNIINPDLSTMRAIIDPTERISIVSYILENMVTLIETMVAELAEDPQGVGQLNSEYLVLP